MQFFATLFGVVAPVPRFQRAVKTLGMQHPFQHGGIETIYMLEGEVNYRHGDNIYDLKPGDTLFFDADAPHGPEELVLLPARYLSIISYPQNT